MDNQAYTGGDTSHRSRRPCCDDQHHEQRKSSNNIEVRSHSSKRNSTGLNTGGSHFGNANQSAASVNYGSSNLRVKSSQSPVRERSAEPQIQTGGGVPSSTGAASNDFTEVFSWGSDRHGQLGLGSQMSAGKALHNLPRFCSYNIPIFQISCGEKHAAFITSKCEIPISIFFQN